MLKKPRHDKRTQAEFEFDYGVKGWAFMADLTPKLNQARSLVAQHPELERSRGDTLRAIEAASRANERN